MKARMWVGLFLLSCSVVGMSLAPYVDQGHEMRRAMGTDIPVSPMADADDPMCGFGYSAY